MDLVSTIAAIFDLNGPARYVHWGWFQMSIGNLAVIVLMIVLFVLALILPFPGRRSR